MDDVIIRATGLSKLYRIGLKDERYDTLGALLLNWLYKPIINYRRVRNLGTSLMERNNDQDVFWALRDIDFNVRRGEVWGVIGKNGAGKSTLLKILSRITEPSAGRVEIFGRIASLLEIGTGFNPELTGRENIYLNGTILGMSKGEIENKFDEIVDFSGVAKFVDTPVKRYSSGMKVRLAFAVAAHIDTEILIVDEVLAVGDAEFQKKCLGKMKDIAEGKGRTVLFVSHNMAAVQNLCTHGLVLKDGRVTYFGDISGAIASYLHQFINERRSVSYNLENAPGNSLARFVSASVRGYEKGLEELIRAGDAIELEFCFEVLGGASQVLDITFHLSDELGVLVFVGSTGFDNEWKGRYASNDLKLARCIIPANLMNEGTYVINRLLLVKDRGFIVLSVNDVIQFDIMAEVNEELGWVGRKEGTVRPYLKWSLNKL